MAAALALPALGLAMLAWHHTAGIAVAAPPVQLEGTAVHTVPPHAVDVLVDHTRRLTIEQILSPGGGARFQPRAVQHLNFGTTRATVWLRFRLRNDSRQEDWVLLVDNPRLERVMLHLPRSGGSTAGQLSGNHVAMRDKAIEGREVAFPIALAPGTEAELHIGIETGSTLSAPLKVLTPNRFHWQARITSVILGGFFGAVALLAAFSLHFFAQTRDWRFLAFALMTLSHEAHLIMQDSVISEVLWLGHPASARTLRLATMFGMEAFTTAYVVLSLDLRHLSPSLQRVGLATIGAAALSAALTPWLSGPVTNRLVHALAAVAALTFVAGTTLAIRRGHRGAWINLAAALPLTLVVLLLLVHSQAWLPVPTAALFFAYKGALLACLAMLLIGLNGTVRTERVRQLAHQRFVEEWQRVMAPPAEPGQPPASASRKPVEILALGQFEVWRDRKHVPLGPPQSSRRKQLLACALAAGGRGISKSQLIDHLWPDADGDLAEQTLRTTLHRVRQALGRDAVLYEDGVLKVNRDRVWDDATEFDALCADWLNRLGQSKTPVAPGEAATAVDRYRGDLLPGVDIPTVTARRELLRRKYHALVLAAGSRLSDHGHHRDALRIFELALERSEQAEEVYHASLRCQLALGQVHDARETLRRCLAFLTAHGLPPSPETKRLGMLVSLSPNP